MSDHESYTSSRPVSPIPELQTPRPYRFNWDPAIRRPGPESVSGTTEGRAHDDFGGLPQLGLLNTSSTVSLALGALPNEWSSSRHGFHAISTVLNNPHKRQAPPKAHSALPSVPPADLPRVRRKDFDSYLSAIAPEWGRFERNTQLGHDGVLKIEDPSTPRPYQHSPAPTTQFQVQREIPPLDIVPRIYFEQQFNLGDPRTFNVVTERPSGIDPFSDSDPISLSYSLPLIEKLSHYADTVEQHLVREISLRSTSFFAALTNLHELQSESEECLDRIARLRDLLSDVDTKTAKKGLEVVRKDSRMRNLGKVREGVKHVSSVIEMTGVARGLVSAGQWGEALGVIEDLEGLWETGAAGPSGLPPPTPSRPSIKPLSNGHTTGRLSSLPPTPEERQPSSPILPPPVPLSALHAFAALPSHLRALSLEITSSLSSELVSVLRLDLLERIGGKGGGGDSNQGLKDRLRPLLQGLLRTKGLKEATLTWREVVLGEMRGVIKRHVPPFEGEDDDSRSESKPNSSSSSGRPGLANHLRSMAHTDFLVVIQDIYRSLLNAVEGLQAQGAIILEVIGAVNSPNPPNISTLREELAGILSSAAELSNTQAARVISLRSEQHSALELPDFLAFFNDSWSFVVKCEVICGRMIVGLRGVVVSQSRSFLQTFHQARISQSAKLVEDEQWAPYEVTPGLQHITNVLVDCAVRDAPELVVVDPTTHPPPSASTLTPASHATNGSARPPSPLPVHSPSAPVKRKLNGLSSMSKNLRIEDHEFFIVSATAEVLILLLDYLRVIVNLPMLTTDTMSRIIEFLKAFNSRTCQVVLGAGAMRSAGLKNITAKHLALASQSLSIMVALIPYIRETFRRHLSSKQAVMLVEFDKLKRDFQEHQNEIHSKLIAIMGDRLTVHIKTLQAINWEAPTPAAGKVNEYMELLAKETTTLYKVLSRYLSPAIVEDVMAQVFAAINHRLSEEYGKIELPHPEAKLRLLADAKYLHQKLSVLKNVGAPSGMLETVIAELSISRTPTSATAPKPTTSPIPVRTNSANQRLRGLLSGGLSSDRALPATPPTHPLASSPPQPASSNSSNRVTVNGRASSSTPPLQPAPPPRTRGAARESDGTAAASSFSGSGSGFRQVNEPGAEPEPAQMPPVPVQGLLSRSESSSADLIASADSEPLPPGATPLENSNPPRPTASSRDGGGKSDGASRSDGGKRDASPSGGRAVNGATTTSTSSSSRVDSTEDRYVHF